MIGMTDAGGIPGVEEEAYFSSYLDSPGQGTGVHSVLCLEGRTEMCFDAVREGSSVTPQKYPRIFIIILVYILGMN